MPSKSLWDMLASPRGTRPLHVWDGERYTTTRWPELVADARRRAAGLRRLGAQRGETIGFVLTNSADAAASLVGAWFAGARVASLPIPSRGLEIDEYRAQIVRLCEELGTDLVLTERRFAPLLEQGASDLPLVTYESLDGAGELDPDPPGRDEGVFVQYSSGSTARPTGCVISARAIERQIGMIVDRGEFNSDDCGVTWLPLSHDMGLFGGLLMPWTLGAELAVGRPERFLASPRTWMRDCAELGATWTLGPNFGVAIAARAAARTGQPKPIGLRYWVIGSDPIQADALEGALDVLGPHGLEAGALAPAYGLAEATLAVTMTPPGDGPTWMRVDRGALLDGELVERDDTGDGAMLVVASGSPVRDVELRVEGDRPVGEICARSPSLASGYVSNPEKERERFRGDELWTGDLGFARDGLLYVVGRKDDMLSVGGRNVYATDLEAAFMNEPGVRKGGCVLVDLPEESGRRLVVLVEPSEDAPEYREVAHAIQRLAANRGGVGLDQCLFVARGTLPKTPSGKVQRFACRQLIARERLDPIEEVVF
jgi:fatty-acyl-CoA synthase